MKRWFWRFGSVVLVCFGCLAFLILIEVIVGWRSAVTAEIPAPQPQPGARKTATAEIKDYSRPEVDTYLSFPEWYIVWAYQEKSDFQKSNLPGGFPYFASVQQYWHGFWCVGRLIKGKYPADHGEQFAQVVIGTSFSAEYILKGLYEETIGKVSQWTSGHQFTAEDLYASRVAGEYADFVHIRPFYEFHFAHALKGLWTENPFWGPHLLRKWERRAFLTLDYAIEGSYSWVIEKGSHLGYGYEPDQTFVWIENVDRSRLQEMSRVKLVKQVGPRAYIASVPRYQEFTPLAAAMSQRAIQFTEIAGNSSIVISVVAPNTWRGDRVPMQRLFDMPIVIRPAQQRIVFRCDVSALDQFLIQLPAEVMLEHIYDY